MPITPAAQAHAAHVRQVYGSRITRLGTCNVRYIDGDPSKGWSQHAYCNANDIFAAPVYMAAIAGSVVSQRARFSPATVIYNRRIWSYKTLRWSAYRGDHPHTDHVHVDYLPRYWGAPPGVPVGGSPSSTVDYPWPPTVAEPYSGSWRLVIATQLWGEGSRPARPERQTVAQIAAGVVGFHRSRGQPAVATVSRRTWELFAGRVLRRGHNNWAVGTLQMFLARYGLGPGPVDNIFGPRTEQAVVRFQTRARVPVDARVEGPDWRALWWGPLRWELGGADLPGGIIDWERPSDLAPAGRIEHSWEATLYALAPGTQRAAAAARSYATSVRQVTQ